MDFQQHRHYKKNLKTLIRFIIYIAVIAFLLFLILDKDEKQAKNEQIKNFSIEVE